MFVKKLLNDFILKANCSSGINVRSLSSRPSTSQMSNMMDIGSRSIFNEDNDSFRESVRRWMTNELSPKQSEFESNGRPSREIWSKLGEQGLLGVSIESESSHGVGGSFKDEAIVIEEQCYANCPSPNIAVHSTICLPYYAHYGTQSQKDEYLPDLVSGKKVASVGMTEPGAGSDLQGIRTHAKKDGQSKYILNGSKVFITNGILANTHLIVAVTDPNAKSKAHGISLFVVDADSSNGFSRGKNLNKMGLKGQDTAELFLEDVVVDKELSLLGKENEGFYMLMNELPQERLILAVGCAANCEYMFEQTRMYLKTREAFGGTLSQMQVIRHRLADLKCKIAVCRAFIDQCIEMHDQGNLTQELASMAKLHASELENEVAAECVQLHGGWGYMWETPICRCYVNARVQTIYGGTSEIMRELISRNIVK